MLSKKVLNNAVSWSLSLIAIIAAVWLAKKPMMVRIGYVVSDQISRGLGVAPSHRIVLVRLDQTFPKKQFEDLLSNAIPVLVRDYRVEVVGVDIDFFSGPEKYDELATRFAAAAANKDNPGLREKVIWAVTYLDAAPATGAVQKIKPSEAFCENCSDASCKGRFTAHPVFGTDDDPTEYGLAITLPDEDGVNRWSPRFVCQRETQGLLNTFHFKIVSTYCSHHPQLVTCRDLQPNHPAKSRLYAWYQAESIDLCRLVNCHGEMPGTADGLPDGVKRDYKSKLANNIVILYWDEPGSDEHMTMLGTEKGAEIVASLIENELQFGTQSHWKVEGLRLALEIAITLLLFFLFHYKYTKSIAILLAGGLFVLYLRFAPRLSYWVPDFRDYVFVLILAFWLEVLLKSAYHDITSAVRSRKDAKSPKGAALTH